MVFAHPAGDERHQRQPKQQVRIRPQDLAVYRVGNAKHVVMIVPIDADIYEAQHISQQRRNDWAKRSPVRAMGDFQFQNHDRDYDRNHAIAERFKATFFHILQERRLPTPTTFTWALTSADQLLNQRSKSLEHDTAALRHPCYRFAHTSSLTRDLRKHSSVRSPRFF